MTATYFRKSAANFFCALKGRRKADRALPVLLYRQAQPGSSWRRRIGVVPNNLLRPAGFSLPQPAGPSIGSYSYCPAISGVFICFELPPPRLGECCEEDTAIRYAQLSKMLIRDALPHRTSKNHPLKLVHRGLHRICINLRRRPALSRACSYEVFYTKWIADPGRNPRQWSRSFYPVRQWEG